MALLLLEQMGDGLGQVMETLKFPQWGTGCEIQEQRQASGMNSCSADLCADAKADGCFCVVGRDGGWPLVELKGPSAVPLI